MAIHHILGFPRIGARRELKTALEAYWQGKASREALLETGGELRARHWRLQREKGVGFVAVGDFSFYDHVLDTSLMLGVVPPRFAGSGARDELDLGFRMARGCSVDGREVHACEMTKWFDTNYHYIVPEFHPQQTFHLSSGKLFQEIAEARRLGHGVKPVLLGPLSYLWLGKTKGKKFDRLSLLDDLIPVYGQILARCKELGVEWVQMDEPVLVLDLPQEWRNAFEYAYNRLQGSGLKLLVASYFGALGENLRLACQLPVEGLHIDAVRAPHQVRDVLNWLPAYKVLSVGIIDGRNVWRGDLDQSLRILGEVRERLGSRLWIAPSCSLLHVPVDLELEDALDAELKSWMAFAVQKLDELALLRRALEDPEDAGVRAELAAARQCREGRLASSRTRNPAVRERLKALGGEAPARRSPFEQRRQAQQAWLKLPLFPTTTIGSFPQTREIRRARRDYRNGALDEAEYRSTMRAEIARAIEAQVSLGLDVLVHGEAERNDMVEYFGELLDGCAITRHGWVQSYGSRCVKPPVIYGDVYRGGPMTVEWMRHARSLTDKPVKGMLTGPVTILNWSFVRDDQPRKDTCRQIALALRDEVLDLENSGVRIIQIDEAALREGLPLRKSEWRDYLDWAVQAFHIASCAVADSTQIHTHMCYSEFNDIMTAISAMDADVITIETSRSDMDLLESFEHHTYTNDIGPGVYDIHSPNIPDVDNMIQLIRRACDHIAPERLWINPDCGLKTRRWPEVIQSLERMVAAAARLREEFQDVGRGMESA